MKTCYVPMAALLTAARDRESDWTLASVLLGEAVLGQCGLAISARIRDVVSEAVQTALPVGTLCAIDGNQGFAIAVPLCPDETVSVLEPALISIAVIPTSEAELRVTPAAAVTSLPPFPQVAGITAGIDAFSLLGHARAAALHALERGDLRVVTGDEGLTAEMTKQAQHRRTRSRDFAHVRTLEVQRIRLAHATAEATDERQVSTSVVKRRPIGVRQIIATYLVGLLIPFLSYLALAGVGLDLLHVVYPILVVALLGTAVMILVEAVQAIAPTVLPELSNPEPPASALVAAHLPNEASTIMATIHHLLDHHYSAGLQVVLAYNTPTPLPVEHEFELLAAREPRFIALRVEHSTSKAANVNAALAFCTGDFIGVFDADHMPVQGSFARAWRWLQPTQSNDAVQGHCVVRNAAGGRLARTVAMEFESIYAVAHPGRARLYGFGVFGGSNGYWRASRLHTIRMHEEMLTEDIDATARLLLTGGRIVSDPGLISTELAPASLRSLWTQRMRWAQGWHQVSRRHLSSLVRNPHFTLRQKAGAAWLFGWREVYPWISLQSLPILLASAFLAGPRHTSWGLPLFVAATIFTLANGPLVILLSWRLAVPELRVQRRWWLGFLLLSIPFAEMKNLIGRVAQVKELLGERHWQVTERPVNVEAAEAHSVAQVGADAGAPAPPRPSVHPGVSVSTS